MLTQWFFFHWLIFKNHFRSIQGKGTTNTTNIMQILGAFFYKMAVAVRSHWCQKNKKNYITGLQQDFM